MHHPNDSPDRAQALAALNVPSILLIVTGVLGIVWALLGLTGGGGPNPAFDELLNDPNLAQYRNLLESSQGAGRFANLLPLLTGAFTIFGAVKMRKLESYGLALVAAIVAMVPCVGPCCCIGLPVGIWAVVTLNKPEVKAAFR